MGEYKTSGNFETEDDDLLRLSLKILRLLIMGRGVRSVLRWERIERELKVMLYNEMTYKRWCWHLEIDMKVRYQTIGNNNNVTVIVN